MEQIIKSETPHAIRFELHKDNIKVSSLIVFDYEFTYNCARLRMGGIAGVQTAEEFRNQGYASRLLRATIDWMTEEEYDCSFLFGIPDFYWRYGYATTLTHGLTSVEIDSVDIAAPSGLRIRELRASDVPAIRELYNQNNRYRMCSIIRRENWSGFPRGSDWQRKPACFVVESESGELEGYAVYDADSEELVVSEVETRVPNALYMILYGLRNIGSAKHQKEFTFLGATSHPFAVFCRRFGAMHQDTIEKYGFGMGRIISLKGFFESISSELTRRSWMLPQVCARSITFITDIGNCTLEVEKGSVRVSSKPDKDTTMITCSQMELTRLVFGVVDFRTFAVSDRTTIEGDAEILDVLFPPQLSTIPPTLWF